MNTRRLVAPIVALSVLCPLAACSSSDTSPGAGGGGAIEVIASGESLATEGFAFPPTSPDEPYFVDGWAVRIERLLVAVGDITVSTDPDKSPSDQSQIGAPVARLDGTYVVDLAKGGDATGKEGEPAVRLGRIESQNLAGGAAFDEATKYAFSYATVVPTAASTFVNVAADDADVADMIARGHSVVLVGYADHEGTTCTPDGDARLGAVLPNYKYRFRFAFSVPRKATNCDNPDLGDGTEEGAPRGLFVKAGAPTVAQITMHADHAFWSAREEDAPLRFDAFAAIAHEKSKTTAAIPQITEADLRGVAFAPMSVGGAPVANRTCDPASAPTTATLSYDPKGAPLADLHDFVAERVSTMAHLNADGLCFIGE